MESKNFIINEDKCLKLICGAGNENLKEIEALSFVFASAGFNMIDVSAKSDVIKAAYNGLRKANKENEVSICVSVGLQDDVHLSKVVINKQKCVLCEECIAACLQDALFIEDEKVLLDDKKCIGCARCIDVCKENAIIQEHKYKQPHEMLLPLLSEKIDCVEFHCSSDNISLIVDSWNKIQFIYKGQLSICLDRSKLGDEKIINLLSEMIKNKDNVIIQADGKPMSGGKDDYKSNLQTVAFAELIRNAKLPVFLILSGGTNSKTSKMAKECSINIDGVALGSYARKLVKEYISNESFWDNIDLQNAAIQKARDLAIELVSYL